MKCGVFQSSCFKERRNMAVAPNLWVTIHLYKNLCLLVIKWDENHPSMPVGSMRYVLGKDLFQLLLLKVFETFLSRHIKKIYSILWSV